MAIKLTLEERIAISQATDEELIAARQSLCDDGYLEEVPPGEPGYRLDGIPVYRVTGKRYEC